MHSYHLPDRYRNQPPQPFQHSRFLLGVGDTPPPRPQDVAVASVNQYLNHDAGQDDDNSSSSESDEENIDPQLRRHMQAQPPQPTWNAGPVPVGSGPPIMGGGPGVFPVADIGRPGAAAGRLEAGVGRPASTSLRGAFLLIYLFSV